MVARPQRSKKALAARAEEPKRKPGRIGKFLPNLWAAVSGTRKLAEWVTLDEGHYFITSGTCSTVGMCAVRIPNIQAFIASGADVSTNRKAFERSVCHYQFRRHEINGNRGTEMFQAAFQPDDREEAVTIKQVRPTTKSKGAEESESDVETDEVGVVPAAQPKVVKAKAPAVKKTKAPADKKTKAPARKTGTPKKTKARAAKKTPAPAARRAQRTAPAPSAPRRGRGTASASPPPASSPTTSSSPPAAAPGRRTRGGGGGDRAPPSPRAAARTSLPGLLPRPEEGVQRDVKPSVPELERIMIVAARQEENVEEEEEGEGEGCGEEEQAGCAPAVASASVSPGEGATGPSPAPDPPAGQGVVAAGGASSGSKRGRDIVVDEPSQPEEGEEEEVQSYEGDCAEGADSLPAQQEPSSKRARSHPPPSLPFPVAVSSSALSALEVEDGWEQQGAVIEGGDSQKQPGVEEGMCITIVGSHVAGPSVPGHLPRGVGAGPSVLLPGTMRRTASSSSDRSSDSLPYGLSILTSSSSSSAPPNPATGLTGLPSPIPGCGTSWHSSLLRTDSFGFEVSSPSSGAGAGAQRSVAPPATCAPSSSSSPFPALSIKLERTGSAGSSPLSSSPPSCSHLREAEGGSLGLDDGSGGSVVSGGSGASRTVSAAARTLSSPHRPVTRKVIHTRSWCHPTHARPGAPCAGGCKL